MPGAPRRGRWNRGRTHVWSPVNIPLLGVCQVVACMATGVGSAGGSFVGDVRRSMRFIVAAASSGTIIEWYDFYIFVTLGFILTPLFFKLTADPAVNFLAFLATYASGFAVRPFEPSALDRTGTWSGGRN